MGIRHVEAEALQLQEWEGEALAPNVGLGGRDTAPTVGMGKRSLVPSVQMGGTNCQPSATQPIVFVFASGTQVESVVICQSPKFKSLAKKAKPWRP
ncbi:hypothetical protein GBA52_020468 [Prunus armeniaca]|nr:hypothetical protein GBA52_020468 [Prunus armeniaca]